MLVLIDLVIIRSSLYQYVLHVVMITQPFFSYIFLNLFPVILHEFQQFPLGVSRFEMLAPF